MEENKKTYGLPFSVLMSVYEKERPEFLRQALESIFYQTCPMDELLLICDGPLTAKLDEVIAEYEASYKETVKVIRLKENGGLGKALAVGVSACKNELILRMDSDDIALPDRFEKQRCMFSEDEELSLASGTIAEFTTIPEDAASYRRLPSSHEEILTFAKRRNPMNHMAVAFKKSAVLKSGNYQPMALAEDYYLWARMLMSGVKTANLPDVLVYARAGRGMIKRRGGIRYAAAVIRLEKALYRTGLINRAEAMENILIRVTTSLIPESFRQWVYSRFLR